MKLAMMMLGVALAGCSASSASDNPPVSPPPAAPPPDAVGCGVEVRIDPPMPIADPTTIIHVTATPIGPSAMTYAWKVNGDAGSVTLSDRNDRASIEFLAATPGVYAVSLTVTTGGSPCTLTRMINVKAPGANIAHVRLRVTPPASLAVPPLEEPLTIEGGANADLGVVVVKRGVPVAMQVLGETGGVPAYLRFSPDGARDAVVEAFADSTGEVTAMVADGDHTVLIVPALGAGVPRRVTRWQASAPSSFSVVSGSSITGTVMGPDNKPVADAKVQLVIDSVPSTLGTTDATGRFALQASTTTGDMAVTVSPPVASGLPRLLASAVFDLGQDLNVQYASNLQRRSLGGLRVQRDGAAIAGAKLVVVGTLGSIGTVTAGASVTATGEVRIAVTADGTGTLPAVLAPEGQLAAVITVAPGDLAVAALDTTSAALAVLEAPAMQVIATAARDVNGATLPGAVLDVVPRDALAMAGASPLHVIADGNGAFSAALAAGGHYDLRFHDPRGRAAPRPEPDRVATSINREGYELPKVITIRGALLLAGTQPLPNASVQILCSMCTGVERAKPIAEVVSDQSGQFTLAVPDPGTDPGTM